MPEKTLEEPFIAQTEPASLPLCGFCALPYYQQYFQVTTDEVIWKIFYALTLVWYKKFRHTARKVDFYGPFWIYATLVFSLAASQNLYSFLSRPEHTRFKYTIEYVPKAFAVIFVFGFSVPILFNLLLRGFGGTISYTRVVSIYGYGQCVNVVTMLLCAFPDATSQNFFIAWGAVHSSLFVFLCLKEELVQTSEGNLKFIAVGAMGACQLVLILIYKKYFFGDLYRIDAYYST